VGDVAYNFLIWVNTKFNKIRGWLGLEYWSLSKYLKSRTKQALNFIEGFEDKLADYAHKRGYDGVICGHIHSATIKQLNTIQYINTGDWVESCTAIVETMDGEIKLIEWQ
jgi:UDP-2,3-diacylglucosamine pyrophosphatase LpxH